LTRGKPTGIGTVINEFKWSGKLKEKLNTKSKKRRAKSKNNFKLNLPSYNPNPDKPELNIED
jgi:hypothetical protein